MKLYIVRVLAIICFVAVVVVTCIGDVFASANADSPYMKYLVIAFIIAVLTVIFIVSHRVLQEVLP